MASCVPYSYHTSDLPMTDSACKRARRVGPLLARYFISGFGMSMPLLPLENEGRLPFGMQKRTSVSMRQWGVEGGTLPYLTGSSFGCGQNPKLGGLSQYFGAVFIPTGAGVC